MARHAVARTSEIPEGKWKLVTAGGRPVVVFNLGGEFFALLNRCPHEGASLCHGRTTGLALSEEPGCYALERPGEIIKCPWHGWEFDIRTGDSVFDPNGTRVRRYSVDVITGAEIEETILRAETFPVHVEDSYVVVDV